jgi:hypothetical protein
MVRFEGGGNDGSLPHQTDKGAKEEKISKIKRESRSIHPVGSSLYMHIALYLYL